MTNLIRKLPGHILKIEWKGSYDRYPNGNYILTEIDSEGNLRFTFIATPPSLVAVRSQELELRTQSIEKLGYIGPRLEDDWLCHDDNCGPKKVTGCTDCPYSKKVGANFFYPGDNCYDPVWKKKYKVESVQLGLRLKCGEDLGWEKVFDSYRGGCYKLFTPGYYSILSSHQNMDDFIRILAAKSYEQLREDCVTPVYLYKLDKLSRKTWMEYDDIKRARRRNFLINLEQMDWICNELCLYGIGSEQCKTCKTEQIRNDLPRDNR